MATVMFTVSGAHHLLNIVKFRENISKILEQTWHQSGKYVVEYIQKQMMNTQISDNGRSLPGAYPAVQSGSLYNSVQYTVNGMDGFEIGASVPHAPYLEYGTVRMAARPFTARGIEESIHKLEQLLVNNLNRMIA